MIRRAAPNKTATDTQVKFDPAFCFEKFELGLEPLKDSINIAHKLPFRFVI